MALPGDVSPFVKALRARRLCFCSCLHPAAGPALPKSQVIQEWDGMRAGSRGDAKLKHCHVHLQAAHNPPSGLLAQNDKRAGSFPRTVPVTFAPPGADTWENSYTHSSTSAGSFTAGPPEKC